MKDEFKEMDDLIHKNAVTTDRSLKPLKLPEKNNSWWKIAAMSASAFAVILVVQNSRITTQSDNLLALNETMSWDAAADEWPIEITESIEYLDL